MIERNEDLYKRKIDFKGRLDLIKNHENGGAEKAKEIEKEISKHKTESSSIEVEGMTSLLTLSQRNWNLLYEGMDFEMDILGNLKILVENIER